MTPNHTHTPGEYLRSGHLVYALNEDGTNRFYASVQAGFIRQPRHTGAQSIPTPEDEVVATATLFAAAPDLVAALEDLGHKTRLLLGDDEPSQDLIKSVWASWENSLAALAKARGEESAS